MAKTRQELFNNAYIGIASQGWERAYREYGEDGVGFVGCMYRAPDGKKCAIGWNIPDDKYYEDMEGNTATGSIRVAAGISQEDAEFADELQMVHDNAALPEYMRCYFMQFAIKHGLSIPELPQPE